MKRASVVVGLTWLSVACTSDPAPSNTVPSSTVDAAVSQQVDGGVRCPALTPDNCDVAFGCVNFEAATAALLDQCGESVINVRREGCGYDILQRNYNDVGDTLLAFYDPESGKLKGWWQEDDTGGPVCAGLVPEACTGFVTEPNLCQPPDSGATSTNATDTTVNSKEAGAPDSGSTTPIDGGAVGTLPDGGTVASDGGTSSGTGSGATSHATDASSPNSSASDTTPALDASLDAAP